MRVVHRKLTFTKYGHNITAIIILSLACNYRRKHFQYRPTLLINVGLMSDDSDHLGKRPQNQIYFVDDTVQVHSFSATFHVCNKTQN